MNVNPYLDFDGRCDEAIAFYKSAVGAEVTMLMRYKDMPASSSPGCDSAGAAEKVMHAELHMGESKIFASDGRCSGNPKFHGICLALAVSNDAQAQKVFNALASGGKVTMPLAKTFFSSNFGMLDDRFGISWMILVQA